MDDEYDVIVLGTGLKECILSGLMSVSGKKVLHMDRNSYYGGKSASISPLNQVFQHFGKSTNSETLEEKYGKLREWNIDLIPKLIMANGQLVKLLIHTGITRYLEFKSIEASYVYKKGIGGGGSSSTSICKVPANETEAMTSDLMSLMEKRRFQKFLHTISEINLDEESSWKNMDLKGTVTARKLLDDFGLEENTRTFTGHALALFIDDSYLDEPAIELVRRCKLYNDSLSRFGRSPYLYPLYGLGELPQGFARLSAIYGGIYMLNKNVRNIVYENDKVCGVCTLNEEGKEEIVKGKMVICDPSYVPENKLRLIGKVARAICILNHPVPNTNESSSCQIIIPQSQLDRKYDIYICCLSKEQRVCPKGFYIVLVSTLMQTCDAETDLKAGLDLLGRIDEKFITVDDLYEPAVLKDNCCEKEKNLFISKSYDPTTHFQTTCEDVLNIYEKIMGEPFDFSKVKQPLDDVPHQ